MHDTSLPRFSVSAKSPSRLAFAGLILGNIFLAFGPLFVRMSDTGPVASAFWRVTLAVPVLLVILYFSKEKIGKLGNMWWILLLAGFLFAGDLASWHVGILQTKLANATLFGNSTSLFFPIYGFLIARAWPNRSQAAALVLAAIGAGLLMGRSYEASPENLVGDLFCVLAGVLYTFYFVAMTRARTVLGAWSALIVSTVACVLPLLVFAWALGETIWPTDWTPLLMLALVSQVLGQGLMTYSLVHFSPLVIGLALLTQPVVSGTIGWLIYGERLGALDLVGAIAVAVALVLVRRPDKRAA